MQNKKPKEKKIKNVEKKASFFIAQRKEINRRHLTSILFCMHATKCGPPVVVVVNFTFVFYCCWWWNGFFSYLAPHPASTSTKSDYFNDSDTYTFACVDLIEYKFTFGNFTFIKTFYENIYFTHSNMAAITYKIAWKTFYIYLFLQTENCLRGNYYCSRNDRRHFNGRFNIFGETYT